MMKRNRFWILSCILIFTVLAGCGNGQQATVLSSGLESSSTTKTEESETAGTASEFPSSQPDAGQQAESVTSGKEENTAMKMNVQIGSSTFTATLEDNAAVDSLMEMMKNAPVIIQMSDYSGFEKVGPLGKSLPTSNQQTTAQAGDIVLYNGNQIVIFYGSNSWSYTRLGKIDDLSGWKDALGSGDVTATFSIDE